MVEGYKRREKTPIGFSVKVPVKEIKLLCYNWINLDIGFVGGVSYFSI